MKYKTLILLGLIATYLMVISGCKSLPAYKRGTLARENMALETDPIEAGLRQHTFFSKEASSGGYGGSGGGCGCN